MIYRHANTYQNMTLIHTTLEGTELWLGDYYAATDFNLLQRRNINAVLTAAAMLNISYPRQTGITHKVIDAIDLPTYRMSPHFQESFKFIKQSLKKGNVLVHCAAGISRSATLVLVFLMRDLGITFDEALLYVKRVRPVVNPNEGFRNQLIAYNHFLWDATLKHSLRQSQIMNGYYPENVSYYPQHQKSFFNMISEFFQDKPRRKQYWEWF